MFFPSPTIDRDAAPLRDDLPRARHLVSARWLWRLLNGKAVEAEPAVGQCRLFEVGAGDWQPAAPAHVPGARWLDVQLLEQPPLWNRVPDGILLQRLQQWGIRHDTTVVLSGHELVATARVAHLLLYAGVRDVRLLDGGSQVWAAAGLPLQRSAPRSATPVAEFGLHLPACPHFIVDTQQVRALVDRAAAGAIPDAKAVPDADANANATLVSIRTWNEYCGRTSGYDYIRATGEIAGARWGHAGADGDVNDMGAFHTPEGRMRSAGAIRRLWRDQSIAPGGQLVFYCGTGWRASLAFFYAWLMGWDSISVYDGGWLEWSRDQRNPTINRQRADPFQAGAGQCAQPPDLAHADA